MALASLAALMAPGVDMYSLRSIGGHSVATATVCQVANAQDVLATVPAMKIDKMTYRRGRLQQAVDLFFEGNKADFGRAMSYKDGSYVGQLLRGGRPITEDLIDAFERHPKIPKGWFDPPKAVAPSSEYPAPSQVRQGATNTKRAPLVEWARLGDDLYKTQEELPDAELVSTGVEVELSPLGKFVTAVDDSLSPRILAGDLILIDPSKTDPKRGQVTLFSLPGGDFVLMRYRPTVAGFEGYDERGRTLDSERHGLSVVAAMVHFIGVCA